mmetsp:Transcript_16911/g.54047  ORF Transcript_16911/g.54047 Transcript_16911/m.54047 type:complete len:258 (-) Transcript_16911:51-824(-)
MSAAQVAAWAACLLLLGEGSRVTTRGLTDSSTGVEAERHRHVAAAIHRDDDVSGGGLSAADVAASAGNRSTVEGHQNTTHHHAVHAQHAATGTALGTTHEDEKVRARRLVKQLIADDGGNHEDVCWIQHGDRMGCRADCECGMVLEQCYPKFVSEVGSGHSGHHHLENIGVCGTAMPVLIFLSGALFIFLLSCVVMARMYFQWRESQIAEASEGVDRPKQSLLLPSGSGSMFPPAEKADGSNRKQTVAWPEVEDVAS